MVHDYYHDDGCLFIMIIISSITVVSTNDNHNEHIISIIMISIIISSSIISSSISSSSTSTSTNTSTSICTIMRPSPRGPLRREPDGRPAPSSRGTTTNDIVCHNAVV